MFKLNKCIFVTFFVFLACNSNATEVNISPVLTGLSLSQGYQHYTANILFESKSKKILYGPTMGITIHDNIGSVVFGSRVEYRFSDFYMSSGIILEYSSYKIIERPFLYAIGGVILKKNGFHVKLGLGLTNPNLFSGDGEVSGGSYKPTFIEELSDIGPAFEVKLGYGF